MKGAFIVLVAALSGCAARGPMPAWMLYPDELQNPVSVPREEPQQVLGIGTLPSAPETCDHHAVEFLATMGAPRPRAGCAYSLVGLKAVQKVQGGYLVTASEIVSGGSFRWGMVYTGLDLDRGDALVGTAQLAGIYRYIGLDGFEHAVPAFKRGGE